MKLQELIVLLRKKYDSRNLKCNARYAALNNVAGYIRDRFGGDSVKGHETGDDCALRSMEDRVSN